MFFVRTNIFWIFFLCFGVLLFGQQNKNGINQDTLYYKERKKDNNLFHWARFSLRGYGVVNYYHYKFDTNPNQKDEIDPERLNLYLDYQFSNHFVLRTELEFEHGGVGVALDLEPFEEGGEFEQEIETGGAVKLEQLYINFLIKPYFNLKVGRFKVKFGLAQNFDEPTEYFTSYRPEMENQLLPLGWYETGVDVYGSFWEGKLRYHVAFINGLDGTGFNSQHFIRDGHQTRFERVKAEDFSISTRLDYCYSKSDKTFLGFSTYYGNTGGNRPKNDIDTDAFLTLLEGHLTYFEAPFRFASTIVWGYLENSAKVSFFNARLSNNLGVKRTPVGSQMLGFSCELGYNVFSLFTRRATQMKLYPFIRYDFYDSMYKVAEGIADNPRWERSVFTSGVNCFFSPEIVLKLHYSRKVLGARNIDPLRGITLSEYQVDKIFSVGIGFLIE